MKEIEINSNEAGQRFDKFLGKYLDQAPKSFLYKMLRKKNITLNKKKASGNEKLKPGDQVQLFFSQETFEKFSVLFELHRLCLEIVAHTPFGVYIFRLTGIGLNFFS